MELSQFSNLRLGMRKVNTKGRNGTVSLGSEASILWTSPIMYSLKRPRHERSSTMLSVVEHSLLSH